MPSGMAIRNCNTVATMAMANDIHMFSPITVPTGFSYLNERPKSPLQRLPSHLKYPPIMPKKELSPTPYIDLNAASCSAVILPVRICSRYFCSTKSDGIMRTNVYKITETPSRITIEMSILFTIYLNMLSALLCDDKRHLVYIAQKSFIARTVFVGRKRRRV